MSYLVNGPKQALAGYKLKLGNNHRLGCYLDLMGLRPAGDVAIEVRTVSKHHALQSERPKSQVAASPQPPAPSPQPPMPPRRFCR
jgi:hypothetical protein